MFLLHWPLHLFVLSISKLITNIFLPFNLIGHFCSVVTVCVKILLSFINTEASLFYWIVVKLVGVNLEGCLCILCLVPFLPHSNCLCLSLCLYFTGFIYLFSFLPCIFALFTPPPIPHPILRGCVKVLLWLSHMFTITS